MGPFFIWYDQRPHGGGQGNFNLRIFIPFPSGLGQFLNHPFLCFRQKIPQNETLVLVAIQKLVNFLDKLMAANHVDSCIFHLAFASFLIVEFIVT